MRVPGYSPEAVAEHAMALALTAIRHTHKAYVRVRENDFSLNGLMGITLHGKTAGIIGTGKIGSAMAKICRGFGMDVIAYDKYENSELDFVKYMSFYDEITSYYDPAPMSQAFHDVILSMEDQIYVDTATDREAAPYVDEVIQTAEANGAELQIW